MRVIERLPVPVQLGIGTAAVAVTAVAVRVAGIVGPLSRWMIHG